MKTFLVATVAIAVVGCLIGHALAEGGGLVQKPQAGYVPDETTAKAIAEAISKPIFGDKVQKPHVASLSNGVWTVVARVTPAAETVIKISQDDAKILSVEACK